MTAGSGEGEGRVIVAGGSVAGLFAGALLRRRGWRVDVFERSGEALASRGAGIVSHAELFDALARAGVVADETVGVQVAGRIMLDRAGTSLGEHPLPQTMMSWDRLYRLLHDAFPTERYHESVAVEGFAQDRHGVTVRLAGGRSERADWLIAADGMRSTVRRQLWPDLEPAYAGYVAWRGLVEESAMSDSARAALCDRLAFCLPPGEQMVGYAVPGADEATAPGRRRYNWVWYRPADATSRLPALLTGRDGRRYDLSIPPNRLKSEAVAGLHAAAEQLLPPCFVEVVRLARAPFIQAICDLESPKLVLGRVVVLGDAAFVARPHAGLGATKAALDALGLAQALSAPNRAAALAAWEEERLRYGRALVARCRWLAAYLEPANFVPDEPPAVIRERIATVIAETAVSGGV